MDHLKQMLNIEKKNEQFTAHIMKPRNYNKVKDNIPLIPEKNFMMDYLFLPETKQKYRYLLVIVDLATDKFDMEPMQNKEPENVLKAIFTINKRRIINLKKNKGQSVRTDGGKEFKGTLTDWLYDNSILHRISRPYRHIQLPNIERLNGEIGKLLNGYMNAQEIKTKQPFKEWVEAVPIIRKELNKIREKKLPKNIYDYDYEPWDATKKTESTEKHKDLYEFIKPKFKVGDLVYVKLEAPENSFGEKQIGGFREGDYRWSNEPRKILSVLTFSRKPYYRYIVNTYPNVSYQEAELKKAKGEDSELYEVKQILKKRVVKVNNRNITEYLVWWYGERKKQATWEPKANLMKFVPGLINDFDNKK